MDVSDLTWVDPGYELDDFLTNPRIELPQFIKLENRITSGGDYESIEAGQVLLVHEKRTVAKLAAKDGQGQEIILPVACPFKVRLELENEESYENMHELATADPLPKFVEVTKVNGLDNVKLGDRLKVVIVEKGGGGAAFVHFRSASGKHVKIAMDAEISFKLTVNDAGEQFLADVVSKSRELPVLISFLKPKTLPKPYGSLGTVQLNKGFTEDFVFGSYKKDNKPYAVIFRISPNMKFQIPENYQSRDEAFRNLCNSYSDVDPEDMYNFLKVVSPVDKNSHFLLKYDKLQKLVESDSDSDPDYKQYNASISEEKPSESEHETALKRDEQQKELVRQKQKEVEKLAKAEKERLKAEKKREKKAKKEREKEEKLEKGKEFQREKKKSIISGPISGPIAVEIEEDTYIEPVHSPVEKSPSPTPTPTSPDASQSSEWGMKLMKKVKKVRDRSKSLGLRPKKRSKLPKNPDMLDPGSGPDDGNSSDVYTGLEEDGYSDNLYEELPCQMYESLDLVAQARRSVAPSIVTEHSGDSGFDEVDSANLKAWRDAMVPPPLPANHPPPRRAISEGASSGTSISDSMYEEAVDSATAQQMGNNNVWKAFYEIVERSTSQIAVWHMEDVANCLRDLNLGQYEETFTNSQVDGQLLLDLDESVLVDLGLSLFEARKLRKFVFGWRPDFMRPDDYPALKGFDSLDPADWSEKDVTSHLNILEVHELAKFCQRNQVNGDLLKDICVDQNVMNSILTSKDKKLKIVKVKNYVIEKWRPKKTGESNYSTFERSFKTASCSNIADSPKLEKSNSCSTAESPKTDRVRTKGPMKHASRTQSTPNLLNSAKNRKISGKASGPARDAPLIAKMKQQLEEKSDWELRKKKMSTS